jgi:starch synthase (maltosyl-transferring)
MTAFLPPIARTLGDTLAPFTGKTKNYLIPSVWLPPHRSPSTEIRVDPATFYPEQLRSILTANAVPRTPGAGGSWTKGAVVYNMFVRTTCAYDHDGNGALDLPVNKDGWRETGTFLKAMAMLPYIVSLGVNTIHLLPITAIGSDGNKGTLGSPYAIKNPCLVDEHLSEPKLGLGVEEELKMFVAAAHHLGLRVVVEFVFRTASKDGDWVKEHPEWFYWIRDAVPHRAPGSRDEAQYGNPIFSAEELAKILAAVEDGSLRDLPPPHRAYREMFTLPPPKDSVHLEGGRYIGSNTERVRIPGAFADWPPDDAQPPWGDVTYLKMYDHPEFNYIAYNTLRMYDERLARKEHVNTPLWEAIAEIIPHYQHQFGIDGVMIDMGHALPMDLKTDMIRRARRIDKEFAFWDENFSVSAKSVEEGYNAVIGYQWSDQHHPEKFKAMLRRFSGEGFALPFFATAESHNTPRAAMRDGGVAYSRYAWALSNLIPAVPFLHGGFELGERYPINTGLDFTREQLAAYPSERLPLFSERAYDWLNPEAFTDWIRRVSEARRRHEALIVDRSPETFHWLETGHDRLIAFIRGRENDRLLVTANSDFHHAHRLTLRLDVAGKVLVDLFTGKEHQIKGGELHSLVHPGEVALFEL